VESESDNDDDPTTTNTRMRISIRRQSCSTSPLFDKLFEFDKSKTGNNSIFLKLLFMLQLQQLRLLAYKKLKLIIHMNWVHCLY